jgi:hypothetical protein
MDDALRGALAEADQVYAAELAGIEPPPPALFIAIRAEAERLAADESDRAESIGDNPAHFLENPGHPRKPPSPSEAPRPWKSTPSTGLWRVTLIAGGLEPLSRFGR